jgi:flagellar basal-body rod protein FlgB
MSMIDTPILRGLERTLDLATFRQQLLASNLANIDTPGYKTRDLRSFAGNLEQAMREEDPAFSPASRQVLGLLERPDGNNVSVERESLLMAQNQLRFQVAVAFLKSEFHRLSTAINGERLS